MHLLGIFYKELKDFLCCDHNNYDIHNFRNWNNFDYYFDTSYCERYPELCTKGAYRSCHGFGSSNMQRYGGYYTKEQMRELVEYARQSGKPMLEYQDPKSAECFDNYNSFYENL